MGAYRIDPVVPVLSRNLYLDHQLKLKRGPDGTELEPTDCMGSGDGYIHFSIITTIGEEAAWQALGDEHAVPCNVTVNLLRPGHIAKGTITGIGRILRAGTGVMVCDATVCQDGRLLAMVTATFVPFVKRPDAVPSKNGGI